MNSYVIKICIQAQPKDCLILETGAGVQSVKQEEEEAALGEGGGDLMANLGIPFVYKEGFGGGNHCVNLNS